MLRRRRPRSTPRPSPPSTASPRASPSLRPRPRSMSPDRPLAALVAIGHAGVVVYLTNVLHALGLRKRRMEALKYAFLAVVIGVSWVLAREVLRGGWGGWSWGVRIYALIGLATAVIGIPASTLWLHLRGRPAGIEGRSSEIDLA